MYYEKVKHHRGDSKRKVGAFIQLMIPGIKGATKARIQKVSDTNVWYLCEHGHFRCDRKLGKLFKEA